MIFGETHPEGETSFQSYQATEQIDAIPVENVFCRPAARYVIPLLGGWVGLGGDNRSDPPR